MLAHTSTHAQALPLPMVPVNTKTAERRTLRLATISDLFTEVDRLAAADRDGRLRHTGNWSLGQALGHLAGWASTPYDGYPPSMPKPPRFVAFIFKFMKGRFLRKGLPAGIRMRGVEAGSLFTEPLSTDEGLARLRHAFERIRTTKPVHPNAVFGDMPREEVEQLNLRHAELHLGFFHPR